MEEGFLGCQSHLSRGVRSFVAGGDRTPSFLLYLDITAKILPFPFKKEGYFKFGKDMEFILFFKKAKMVQLNTFIYFLTKCH